MAILKKITTFSGLLVMIFGLFLSRATAMQTFGHGEDKMICITATFVMPRGTTITGWKVYVKANAPFNTARLSALRSCMQKLFKIKSNYVKAPTNYPVVGPYQLNFLAILCSSNGGAYLYRHVWEKPPSFVYYFKQSDHISSHHPLYRKYCRK